MVRLEPVRLKPLIESVAAELRDLSAQHGITIAIEGADTEVTADPRQVGVLLANLLANAITYSREDGCVTVSVAGTPPPAAIRVSDTGIGIAPDALPHIFDDFYRSHEAVEHNPQSTGLGLAIVRQAARNLGLTIDVESTEGKGTVFTIMFPTNTGGA